MQTRKLAERLELAFNQRRVGNYSEALNEFENLETQSKNSQDIAALRFFQATCLTGMGNIDEALHRIVACPMFCTSWIVSVAQRTS